LLDLGTFLDDVKFFKFLADFCATAVSISAKLVSTPFHFSWSAFKRRKKQQRLPRNEDQEVKDWSKRSKGEQQISD
jgi:hypothetical protein